MNELFNKMHTADKAKCIWESRDQAVVKRTEDK